MYSFPVRLLGTCRTAGLPPFKLSLLYKIFLLGVLGYENTTHIGHNKLSKFDFVIWGDNKNRIYLSYVYVPHVWESRISGQLCGYKGIDYSSPTLASAIGNLSPAFTFILAVIFRFFHLLFHFYH
jgi:hypothetical protein